MPLFVTDTHPLIWYATGQYSKLSRKALRIMEEAERAESLVYIPAPVLLEITVLLRSRNLAIRESLEEWADRLLRRGGFEFAPLDRETVIATSTLTFTSDIFDAAIVATARVKDLPLITKDMAISESGLVEIAW
jgi:PIN domain nuclease of toxin-antitoxin system